MASGRFEVRCLAHGVLMDVNGMLARRQVLQFELDGELAPALLEASRSGILAGTGRERDDGRFPRLLGQGRKSDTAGGNKRCKTHGIS